jgi:DNA-directed RNA polymerase specialized sigma24 family protein
VVLEAGEMSGSKDEATQDSERDRYSQEQTVLNELLNDLPINDRQAILRFYVHEQSHDEIVAALGLDPDHFRELRRSIKAAFFARTGRGR